MRLLVQRVREASVEVDGSLHADIGPGFLVLAGFTGTDVIPQAKTLRERMLDKLLGLRVFSDEHGKMNLDILSFGGEVLLVSQFTLYADCRKGRRPSFHLAAPHAEALDVHEAFFRDLEQKLPGKVKGGVFGANMDVRLTNWGPVTIMLDSGELGF